MSILDLHKKSLVVLLLSLLALVMLPACSTTEEEAADDCNCAESDLQCKERCAQDLPI